MTPQRIQLSRKKGWRKPENTVVVARPSKWGNPFHIGRSYPVTDATGVIIDFGGAVWTSVPDAAAAVHLFREWVAERIRVVGIYRQFNSADLAQIRGKNLACWCPLPAPGEPDICHAAVLLELANTTEGNTPRSQTDRTGP